MVVLAGRSNDPARGGQPERPRHRGCRRSWVGVLHGPLDAIRKSHDTLQRIATERLPSYGNRSVASRACPGAVGSGQASDLARRCCFEQEGEPGEPTSTAVTASGGELFDVAGHAPIATVTSSPVQDKQDYARDHAHSQQLPTEGCR